MIAVPGWGQVPVGNVANGLCGGMAFAARDFYEYRVTLPTATLPPIPGDPLLAFLVDRLIASLCLPTGPLRYFQWMSLPDEDTVLGRGVANMSILEEWPRLKRELNRRHPVPLGIIRTRSHNLSDLGQNHQVLCYSYETTVDERLSTLHIYDPNHPKHNVTISRMDTTPVSFQQSTGERVRGFFVTEYDRVDPRFLVDPNARPPIFSVTRLVAALRALVRR